MQPAVDARTDLYALGVTAYFLLTGERVFEGANMVEICSAHLHQTPVPPSKKRADIPPALEHVVLSCLEKKPTDRPKSAYELAEKLVACELTWSRADACAWWAKAERAMTERKRPKRARRSTDLQGATVTIALDDRTPS